MASGELSTAELFKEDLYAELEVDETASDKDIKKAYRKRALKCHPDKNPDNPQATKLFNKLSCIFEILANKQTRAEYDKIVAARKAAAERNYQLDAKRRKLKEDLERKEREALNKNEPENKVTATKNLEQMLKDLRSNGSKLLREEQEQLKKELQLQKTSVVIQNDLCNFQPKFKLKWDKNLEPQYDEQLLRKLFSKYGEVSAIVVSAKKRGSAIVEFEKLSSAQLAFENEHGVLSNLLKLEWVGQPPVNITLGDVKLSTRIGEARKAEGLNVCERKNEKAEPSISQINFEEEEEQMFAALRKAAERQKLMQEMKESEDDGLTWVNWS